MTTVGQEAFPSDGKVLIVGMSPGPWAKNHVTRLIQRNPWEVTGWNKLPSGVAGVCVSHKTQRDALSRIKTLANDSGVTRFEVEQSQEMLDARLRFWLGANKSNETLESRVPVQVVGEVRVLVKRLKPLEGQPRTHFSSAKLKELATSIKMIGQQDPVKVVKLEGDPNYDYQLIDGERRHEAIIMLGLPEIWAVLCIVKDTNEQYMRSFAANFAREGHTPLDTARAIQKMLTFPEFKEMGKTGAVKKIAALAGKSDQWAYLHLRLLNLPNEIRKMLEPDGDDRYRLPLTLGTYLSTIDDRDIQLQVCEAVVRDNLSVNASMSLARKLASEAGKTIGSPSRAPHDDYRILATYLRKTVGGAEILLSMSFNLDELFEHRGLKDRQERLAEVEKALDLLQRIRDGLKIKAPTKK